MGEGGGGKLLIVLNGFWSLSVRKLSRFYVVMGFFLCKDY